MVKRGDSTFLGSQVAKPNLGSPYPRGFTLIELVVVLAILMIVIGLLLPALGGAMHAARLARSSAALKQCSDLVFLYANDNRETYPLAHEHMYTASARWYDALIAGDYVANEQEVDPRGVQRDGEVRYALSMCLVYDYRLMRPGSTVPISQSRSSPVKLSEVLFPSQKGAMWQWWINFGPVETYWCCLEWRPVGPVGMADGSVIAAEYTDFRMDFPPEGPSQMGFPVQSTWEGCRGRDK